MLVDQAAVSHSSSDRCRYALDWNGPDHPFEPFPDQAKEQPIAALLKTVVDRHPQRPALLDADSSLTYAELWQAVADWAQRIAATTRRGEFVGIVAPTSIPSAVAMLASLAAGCPFVAIDAGNPHRWIERALDNAKPALLLTATPDGHFSVTSATLSTTFDCANVSRDLSDWKHANMTPDEPAFALFTSGSTGDPKCIINSQRNLLQRVSQSINSAHISNDDRLLSLASISTIVGVRDMITALLAGASTFLLDTQKAGANEILRTIREQRISILFSFPALLRSIVQSSVIEAPTPLRLVRVGGDTTLWSDIHLFRAWLPHAFIQLIYAATEAPMMQWFVPNTQHPKSERIPIGYELPGNTLTVVNDDGTLTRDGEIGELVVCSSYVALGAWQAGRATDSIRIDPENPHMRMWNTGDLVRRRTDGFYERIGRKDRQVKIRGVRVDLEGVETLIRRHPSVCDVGVVVRPDPDGSRLIAYVVARDNVFGNFVAALHESMRASVPTHMRPWRIYAVDSIPRLSSSKLDYRALLAMDSDNAKREVSRFIAIDTKVGGAIEETVAGIWRESLGVASLSADADFFDLGGDSLRAITMVVQLEKALNRAIPLTLINQAPSLGAFCAALKAEGLSQYSPLVVLKAGSGAPPLFLVHGVGGSVMELIAVGRNMTWPGAVVGIQARGLDGDAEPHRKVEAMAEEYISAVKSKQFRGPYFLCGYSFGGLVAFEMARRLQSAGDDVAFVGLIDTQPPHNYLLRLWSWAANLRAKWTRPTRRTPSARNALRARTRSVAIHALSASLTYRPHRYDGAVSIFAATDRHLRLPSLAHRWHAYARALQIIHLKGDHRDLVGSSAESTAIALSECLQAVQERYQATTDTEKPGL